MTAPRPFAEIVPKLRHRIDMANEVSKVNREPRETVGVSVEDLTAILSRLASREAVFEAAVAWNAAIEAIPPASLGCEGAWAVMQSRARALRTEIARVHEQENHPRSERGEETNNG